MSLAGFKNIPLSVFGSLFSRLRAEGTPFTNSVVARNIRFKPKGVITRPGLSVTGQLPNQTPVTGVGQLTLANGTQLPLFLGSDDNGYALYYETPVGSGAFIQLTAVNSTSHANRFADIDNAYGRAWFAFSDLITGSNGESPSWFDGTLFRNVGIPNQTIPVSVGQGSPGGNVESGTRYAVVLYINSHGAISGVTDAAVSVYTASDGTHKVEISNLPISTTSSVTGRIVAFTIAGADQAGPYFYIPANDLVGNIPITSTVINNNTQTFAEFNFTDVYLQGTLDITSPVDFFDKIQLPRQASVFFSPSTQRMIWTGGEDDQTIFRVSEQNDPETYLASTGFIKPSENDSERSITAREFRSQLYLFKEHAGFLAFPTDIAPSAWTVVKQWDRVAPVGPWAVDTSEAFMVFLDKSGVYHYDGGAPVCVSDEISSSDSDIWSNINWSVKQKFWVFIDTDLDEIHIGVAFDGATSPTHVLKCNYLNGFKPGARKWSIDDIPATNMLKMDRTLPASPNSQTPLDQRIATSQIIVLSNNPDGLINIYDPTSYTDNGNRINSRFQSGYYGEPGVLQLGGVGVSGRGQGEIQVKVFKDQSTIKTLQRPLPVKDFVNATIIKANGQSPWWSVEFSNGSNPGDWFEIISGELYVRTIFKTRRP